MKGEMKGRKTTKEELEQDDWKDEGTNYEGDRIFGKMDSKILWDEKSQIVKDELRGPIETRLWNMDTKPT